MMRLLYLRWMRRALMRERARYHQERAGIDWMLKRNDSDARRCEAAIAAAEEQQRQARFSRRYRVLER
jgi:hypothetical protein